MAKAVAYRLTPVVFTLFLLSAPASSQEVRRDASQQFRPQVSEAGSEQDERAAEQSLWESIRGSSDPREFKAFLAKFPHGQFAGEARSRLSALLGEDYVTLFMKHVSLNRQWSYVERQLERRADLLPNLIESLKVAGVEEPEMFGQAAGARSRLLNAIKAEPQGEGLGKTPGQKRAIVEASASFGLTLRQLLSLKEAYPQLRTSESFLRFQDALDGTENRIAVARADYNAAARDYNDAREQPTMVGLAGQHGFVEEPYFKAEQGPPAEPKVKFDPPATTRLSAKSTGKEPHNLKVAPNIGMHPTRFSVDVIPKIESLLRCVRAGDAGR